MTEKDRPRFASVLALLSEAFDKVVSDALADVYFRALRDFPIEAVEGASDRWVLSGKFFPKVAELREIVQGRAEDRALLAWRDARSACERIGAYESVRFEDAVTTRVIGEMGGWPGFCRMGADEEPFRQKDFERLYRVYEATPAGRAVPSHLVGITEGTNRGGGWDQHIPEPRIVPSSSPHPLSGHLLADPGQPAEIGRREAHELLVRLSGLEDSAMEEREH